MWQTRPPVAEVACLPVRSVTMTERFCPDCGVDISERRYNAKRCVVCAQLKYPQNDPDRYRRLHPRQNRACQICQTDITYLKSTAKVCRDCRVSQKTLIGRLYRGEPIRRGCQRCGIEMAGLRRGTASLCEQCAVCSVNGCVEDHEAKGLCRYHDGRQRRGLPLVPLCGICGAEIDKKRRYCSPCWWQMDRDRRNAHNKVHPETRRQGVRTRRARKRRQLGNVTPGIEGILLRQQKYRCAAPGCGKRIGKVVKGKVDYTLDHYYPSSKGGMDDDSNFQILCAPCNQQKHAKDPLAFARERGMLL